MLRLITLSLIALAIQFTGTAQLEFSGGLEVGLSTSQVSGDGLAGYDKFGLSAGPYVRAKFNETSSARMSILLVNKGSRQNAKPKIGVFRTYALKLNYIEVPLLYAYSYKSFRAEAGIAFGTLISSSQREDGADRGINVPFEKTEYSFVGGLNYMVNDHLFLTGRFTQSIIPVRKSPNPANQFSFYEAGQYNSVLQFMVGYEF